MFFQSGRELIKEGVDPQCMNFLFPEPRNDHGRFRDRQRMPERLLTGGRVALAGAGEHEAMGALSGQRRVSGSHEDVRGAGRVR